jgi:uncharacterized small protein (DUF1192 family)
MTTVNALARHARCDKRRRRRYFSLRIQEPAMPAVDDEDRPKKKLAHEIGQDLALLSVEELRERIGLLKDEIARLEAVMTAKQAQLSAADQFFKR